MSLYHIHLIAPPEIHWPELGLTLDELDDYKLIKKIIEHFFSLKKPFFSCTDIVRLLRKHPEYIDINKAVIRKGNT